MICRKAFTAMAALCALALPARAQFSDVYYIYGTDEIEAEWQIGLILEAYQKLPECDRKYGLQSVPIPEGLEEAAFRQSRE